MSEAIGDTISCDELQLLQHLMQYNGDFYFIDVLSSYISIESSRRKLHSLLCQLFQKKMVVFEKVSSVIESITYRVSSSAPEVLSTHSSLLKPKPTPLPRPSRREIVADILRG